LVSFATSIRAEISPGSGLQRRNRFWRLICINDRRGDHGPDHPKRAGGQRLSLRGDYREPDETTETPVTKPSLRGASARGAFATGGLRAAAAAVVLSIAGMTGSALAADPAAAPPPAALSAADQTCLGCHSIAGVEKPLSSGETLSLHIAGDSFAQSVHAALGCTGCHTDVNLASHPPASNSVASKRAFSIAMVQVCRTCHADKFDEWGKSVHAALVSEGNQVAPICTSCHSPHTMIKGAAAAMATVPCQSCHAAIFAAYSKSVHGVLRNGGLAEAPLCFNCHGPHNVQVPSAGVGRRDVCLGCHTEATASHRTWLPNVDLHFSVVSCPVCHVPQAPRRVDLTLYNNATQREIPEAIGMPQFETLGSPTTVARPGLDPATLMTLLTALNPPGAAGKTVLKGRLELSGGVEDHEITFATKAISDCATCHREGSAAFQSVTVSVAGPGGIPVRYDANKDVLSSAFSVPSVGGFYAIGGSRVTFLDVLLVLALLGGIGGPLGHLTVRWFFRHFVNDTPKKPGKG
jgi:hypothetical protein